MKNLLSWILSTIVAVIVFGVAIILIPMETYTTEKVELTYIFVDDNGSEYEIMKNWVHWAADDWSFLFEEEEEDITTDNNTNYLDNKDYILDDNKLENILENNINENVEEINENNDLIIDENKNIVQEELDQIKDNCITPWNNVLKDGEYVLAYQQRADVPTICNIQKRSCIDWVLKWTYIQASCKEDIKYEYTKVKVVSFNNKKHGELIQNPWYAKNDSSVFDTNGKLNEKSKWSNTTRNNSHNKPVTNQSSENLTHKNYYNCTSPWWDIVWHWQFIKAYISPLWFVDQKCQAELRLCLNWVLKWQSSYKTCEYKDMTYLDYIWLNNDITQATPELMVDALVEDDQWLFDRLWNLFN